MAIETLYSLASAAGHDLKSSIGGFDTQSHGAWLRQNGYKQLAAQYGFGARSKSGQNVNEESALQLSAFYGGVKIIGEDMGTMPIFTYERSQDRKSVEKAWEHPLFPVLHDLVNPDIEAGAFVEALTVHSIVARNGFAEIQRSGKTIYLWPWMPSEVRIEYNRNGRQYFLRKEGNAAEKTYTSGQVFMLKGFTLDGKSGDRIVERAREVLGLTLSAQDYAARYFDQDQTPPMWVGFPAGVVKSPEYVKNWKKAWKEHHQGPDGWHTPAVVADGGELHQLQPNAEQAQLNEQRGFQLLEVCRLIRMMPYKLADHSRLTYSNAEQQSREYVQYTLSPHIRRWKQAVHRCLLTENERLAGRIYAEHDVDSFQRGDFATQSEGFRKLLEKGVYSINEVRRLMNMNPVPGGDEHFIQLNLGTVQDVAAGLTLRPENGTLPVGGKP